MSSQRKNLEQIVLLAPPPTGIAVDCRFGKDLTGFSSQLAPLGSSVDQTRSRSGD